MKPFVVSVVRRYDVAPERVFDAWLDPEQASRFLFKTPDGRMTKVAIDARAGGRFEIVERRGETDAPHFGEFVEIDRPRRIVFLFGVSEDDPPSRVTIEIAPVGAGCELTLTHEMAPEWAEWGDRTRAGWSMILEGLADVAA